MAHQTDVHVVHRDFEWKEPEEQVVDPVCGMKLERKEAKHVLFRGEEAVYFCSRECREKYLNPKRMMKAG